MSYTLHHVQVRYGGSAWGGTEQWSCGVKLKHLGGDDLEAMDDEVVATIDDIKDHIITYMGVANAMFSGGVRLNWVRANVIHKDTGEYAFPNTPHIIEGLNVTPPNTNGIPQVAYCVTLRGNPKRGPAARGRYFVPIMGVTIPADGRIATSTAGLAASAAGTFLQNLSTIDSGLGPDAWRPWLFGLGGEGTVAQRTGVDSAIIEVEVGTVLDTQRRRRNSLVEVYQPATTWP